MNVYWREVRRGQRLVLTNEGSDHEEEIGGVRETKRGFDAFAKTFGYEPGRAEKGIPSMDEAKVFVESHRPWELYEGGEGLTVDPEIRPPAPATDA
jgi:hypothetical protein